MLETIEIQFNQGTLLLEGGDPEQSFQLPHVIYDKRTLQFRAPAMAYRDIVMELTKNRIPYSDKARWYQKIYCPMKKSITPRPHQVQALEAWNQAGKRGVVSLPTGAGKTILAVLAIAEVGRPTLVVVPTIDLLHQWKQVLEHYLELKVGALGGGEKEILPITVSTYDSAVLNINKLGGSFGLVVFDECHHLPAPQYQDIAIGLIAPFRLGLSATVERADGKEDIIYELLGEKCYQGQITDMVSKVLAPYDVVNIEVELTEDERREYEESRNIYTSFIRRQGISLGGHDGWMDFVTRSSRTKEGRLAMKSYRLQKRLSQTASQKKRELWQILRDHREERMIIFTNDNAIAYEIGVEFALPVLTHKTKLKERKKLLESFASGKIDVLVTSKVLNEGVDVPEATVAVVYSGSGAVREHVQRLGRILRHKPGKKAVFYELVAKNTGEQFVNKRRREHNAYQKSP